MNNLQQQTVYVVDDDSGMRDAISEVLKSVGYRVRTFANGTEFLEALDENFDGCVILDVRLPGPSGLELQRRLADKNLSLPVVFITGHGDIVMAVQAMKANAVDFLIKPVRDQDLLDAVEVAMQHNYERRRREHSRGDALQRISRLSPRELEVFHLLCKGRLTKQIAPELGMSLATVKVHRRNIIHKIGVKSVTQMVQLHHLLDR